MSTIKFNGQTLTEDSIKKARDWYIANAQDCIQKAREGEFKVNDLQKYEAMQRQLIEDLQCSNRPLSLAFLQRAYYIQTGECIALLP